MKNIALNSQVISNFSLYFFLNIASKNLRDHQREIQANQTAHIQGREANNSGEGGESFMLKLTYIHI